MKQDYDAMLVAYLYKGHSEVRPNIFLDFLCDWLGAAVGSEMSFNA